MSLNESFTDLKELLETYSDDIPKQFLNSTMGNSQGSGGPKFKCRVNWWNDVTCEYALLSRESGVTDTIVKLIQSYLSYCKNRKDAAGNMNAITPQDIEFANDNISKVLQELNALI